MFFAVGVVPRAAQVSDGLLAVGGVLQVKRRAAFLACEFEQNEVVRIVLYGLGGKVTVKGTDFNAAAMPAFGKVAGSGYNWSDDKIAAVLTYVRQEWGNTSAAITPEKVAEIHAMYPDGVFVSDGKYSDFLVKRADWQNLQARLEETMANKARREVEWLRRGPQARATKSKYRIEEANALIGELGLQLDRRGNVIVEHWMTSVPGIFAAGDIARWPDPHSGTRIRVEHWVLAQRQGQVAAQNILGLRQSFDAVPFFWSQHYDTPINYVGHAEGWDAIEVEGDIAARDCLLRYIRSGRSLAVATIFRDVDSLRAEAEMERLAASPS